jgi:Flp pilus assembly protein TadG
VSRYRNFARRLRQDERGATILEFGILVIPLSVCLLGMLDVGYMMYTKSLMQGALNDVSRQATVEKPVFSSQGATVDAKIDAAIKARMGKLVKGGTYTITKTSYYKFSGVGKAEKMTKDVNGNGKVDKNDCWEDVNKNNTFDTSTSAGTASPGGADDVVLYTVNVSRDRITPMAGLIGMPAKYAISVKTLVRNQPYADQPKPPEACKP